MSDNGYQLKIENQIATLILDRPQVHNAFDDKLINDLIKALKQVEEDDSIRALILTSNGKHFSAGADLNWMKRMANLSESDNRADAHELSELMHRLNEMSIPTIALVDGAAYGGAVGLVACCDMAIATQRSRFCLSEVRIGLSPAVISPYVVGAMGERIARRYFLTAEPFIAHKAKEFGLVNEVVSDRDELLDQGQHLVDCILQNSPQAIHKTKQLIMHVSRGAIDPHMRDYTVNLIAAIRVSEEGQEGLSAFLEKREPSWRGEQ